MPELAELRLINVATVKGQEFIIQKLKKIQITKELIALHQKVLKIIFLYLLRVEERN
jgi:hypothetical protein